MTKKTSDYDRQYQEYQKALAAWQARRPKADDNYSFEAWMEEQPEPPRRVRGLSYNDR